MTRTRMLWMAAVVAIAVVVAWQVIGSSGDRAPFVAQADMPTVALGVDVLSAIAEVPVRIHGYDYRRDAFGDSWTDDNPAPGGHNGYDTRNDILNRDLVDKTYVSIKRCPNAVASGTLHDQYTNDTVPFVRGNQVGAAVQIDHIVPRVGVGPRGAELDRRHAAALRQRSSEPDRSRGPGESGQGRQGTGGVDAAQHRVPVPIRNAIHRGVARLRVAGRRAVRDGAA